MHTLGTTVNQWLKTLRVLWIHHVHKCRVDPPTSFYGIETADDEVELHVVVIVLVLDFAVVPVSNLSAFP